MEIRSTRRQLLASTGLALYTTLSGCSNLLDNPNSTNPPGNQDPIDTPEPETPSLEVTGDQEISIEWTPELEDYDQVPEEHQTSVAVEPGDFGFDQIDLMLEQTGTEEPETQRIEINQKETQIPANQLFTGTQEARLEYTNGNGETQTTQSTPLVKNIPQGHRIDVRNTDGESLGDWNTPFSFDTLVFNPEEIEQERQERLKEDELMPNFLENIQNNADLIPGKYHVVRYPNRESSDKGNHDKGHFDLEAWKDTTEFEQMLQWMNSAVRVKASQTEEGAMSTNVDQMAASAELAINEIHPSYETRAWGFGNAGGHGTMMFYDEENQEYWHSDSTAIRTEDYVRKPENAQLHRPDVWSPFTSKDHDKQPGFHPGPVKDILQQEDPEGDELQFQLTYRGKSREARDTLLSIVGFQNIQEKDNIFITDNWIDEAYEHIRNDQSIEPILEPIQQLGQTQTETGQMVGLFGDLENSKLVAGPAEPMRGLYQDAMDDPAFMVDEQHIHNYIEELDTTEYELA